MLSRRQLSPYVLWVAVFALLLKAALPLLAVVSAQAQGKAVAEVCTVYGVVKVAVLGLPDAVVNDQADPGHPGQAHSSPACALTALLTLPAPGVPVAPVLALAAWAGEAGGSIVASFPHTPDACATWVARLKHGPPALV